MENTSPRKLSREHVTAICEIVKAQYLLERNLQYLSARERALYEAVKEEQREIAQQMRGVERAIKRKKRPRKPAKK